MTPKKSHRMTDRPCAARIARPILRSAIAARCDTEATEHRGRRRNHQLDVIVRESGRSSIPETAVLKPRGLWNTGSSAFAEHDSGEDVTQHSRGANCVRALAKTSSLEKQRAQGMPGARRTHCLACKTKKTHAGQHRYAEITPALPAQWLYGLLRALPGVRAF